MDDPRPSLEPESDPLPPALARALSDLYPAPHVPARIDDAILNRSRARFAAIHRLRPILRLASLAAAAAIVLFAVALLFHRPWAPAPQTANRQDLNADGQVDIRDALYLAQHVRTNATRPEWDFNADGQVDATDADMIAMTAVSLKAAPTP
jgi:hypothetical protein